MTHFFPFANDTYIQLPNKVPATGTVYYEDNGVNYQSEFDIDTEHYATIFSFESDEEKLLKEMKNQTAELKRMKESIRAIAQNTKQFNTTEESE